MVPNSLDRVGDIACQQLESLSYCRLQNCVVSLCAQKRVTLGFVPLIPAPASLDLKTRIRVVQAYGL
jgi:hypothetical protein